MVLAAAYGGLVFLVLPTLLVLPMSVGENPYIEFPPSGFTLRWYGDFLYDPGWIQPGLFSFQIALLVSFVSSTIGTMAALALVRGRVAGRPVIQLLILSPIIAPNIVIAIAMFFFFAEVRMIGSIWAFVLGHSVLALPFVVLTVSASLARYDSELDLAALSLGASRWRTFWEVTFPIIRPGVLSGAVFAFIISFDEPVVSFFLSSSRDKTLPRKLFEDVQEAVSPTVAAVAGFLTLATLALLVLAFLLGRRDLSQQSERHR